MKVDPDSSAAVSAGDFVYPAIRSRPAVHRHDDPAARGRRLAAAAAGAERARARRRSARMPTRSCSTASRSGTCSVRSRPSASSRPPQRSRRTTRWRAPQPPSARSRRRARCSRSRSSARSPGRFPRSALVRFHLGVLLLWSREVAKARKQLAAHGEARTRLALCSAGKKTAYSPCSHWDQEWKMMSRTAHGATSDPHGTVRHPKKACTTWYSTTRLVGMTQVGGASECSRG